MHKNQLVPVDAALVDLLAAKVLQLPSIAKAQELADLREENTAHYQEAVRLEGLAKEIPAKIRKLEDRCDELERRQNTLTVSVRDAEKSYYNALMQHTDVARLRAEFGGGLGTEARRVIVTVLKEGSSDYRGKLDELTKINSELEESAEQKANLERQKEQYNNVAQKERAEADRLFVQLSAMRREVNGL